MECARLLAVETAERGPSMRIAIMLIGLVSFAAHAGDDTAFFCGARLVQIGEGKLDVAFKCGEPTLQDRRIEKRDGQRVTVDEWTYNLGSYRMTPRFHFENGLLTTISVGDYGYSGDP
jgi:hypothetical protein